MDKVVELEREILAIEMYVERAEDYGVGDAWAIETLRTIAEANEIRLASYEAEWEQCRPKRDAMEEEIRQFYEEKRNYKQKHPFLSLFDDGLGDMSKILRIKDRYSLPSRPQLVTFGDVTLSAEMQPKWCSMVRWWRSRVLGWVNRDASRFPKERERKLFATEIRIKHVKQIEKFYRCEKETARIARDEEIPRLRQRIERIKNARGGRARVRAAAAAHFDKTRELAATVKNQLRDQRATLPVCPYCGNALGDEPHADHIYPVSRGGFSTPENMVYCCAKCNGTKHDKTLREFILSGGLVRDEVEERLHRLGKRF